mgnify:CR=1 FL=1
MAPSHRAENGDDAQAVLDAEAFVSPVLLPSSRPIIPGDSIDVPTPFLPLCPTDCAHSGGISLGK